MPVVGAPRVFEDRFKYRVEIDGVAHAGFNKCSALEAEIDKIEYREGGRLTPQKSPGLVNISDITLERGAVSSDSDLYDWFTQVVDLVANTGQIEDTFRRNFDIVVLDRDNNPIKRWRCTDAWPTKFTAGDWDNDASEHNIEMVVVTMNSFRRVPV